MLQKQVLLAEYKEREKTNYLKKKEEGHRKCVKGTSPDEHRNIRNK